MNHSPPVCAVVGVGPGNGAAFARRFHAAGYQVALIARTARQLEPLAAELALARPYRCDATAAAEVSATFRAIEAEQGAVEVLLYNAGNAVLGGVENTRPDQLEQALRVNVIGCLLAAQQVVPGMRRRGRGHIVVIGATASRRGSAGALPFAAAKAGQRNLAEAMARELAPAGIHVAHVVIDGVIESAITRQLFPERVDGGLLSAAAVADSVFALAQQSRLAWSFELDLRPAAERW